MTYGTSGGVPLVEGAVARLAAQAEEGYEPSQLRERRAPVGRIFWEEKPQPRGQASEWFGSMAGVGLFFVHFHAATEVWSVQTKLGDPRWLPDDFKTVEAVKTRCERVLVTFLNTIGAAFTKKVITWRKNKEVRSYDGYVGEELIFTIRPVDQWSVGNPHVYLYSTNNRYRMVGAITERITVAEAKERADKLLNGTET